MEEVREEKYLFYNDEGEVLCFGVNDNDHLNHIEFLETNSEADRKNSFNREVLNLLETDNREFLCETVKKDKDIPKLKKIRDYYACYKPLLRDDVKIILDICEDYEVLPDFLSIKYLKDHFKSEDVKISNSAYVPLNELEKKLSLKKW